MAVLDPNDINRVIDKLSKASHGEGSHEVALAAITVAFGSLLHAGYSHARTRKAVIEMIDYAMKNSISVAELMKESRNGNQ